MLRFLAIATGAILLAACSPTPPAAPPAPKADATPTPAPAPTWAPYAGTDKILETDTTAKSVTIHLVAAEGKAVNGMNFNGYGNGDMQLQVPTGWKVKVVLTVGGGSLPHSALLVPWTEKDKASKWTLAFPHAAVDGYTDGMEAGDAPQTFHFTAGTAGQYAMICGVPGHLAMGMWDEFDVVDGLAAPQVLVRS